MRTEELETWRSFEPSIPVSNEGVVIFADSGGAATLSDTESGTSRVSL
jgi:hypothetical protein